jgi:hypothetical protein
MSRGTIRLGMTNLLVLSPVPNRVIQGSRYDCQRAREARKLNEVTVVCKRNLRTSVVRGDS